MVLIHGVAPAPPLTFQRNRCTNKSTQRSRLRSALFLSPCRLWFADNGHINVRCGPSDADSLALSDRGLGVARRNVYDPTIVRRGTIVLALGGEGGDGKANNKCGDEKKLRHLATFLCGRTNPCSFALYLWPALSAL